MTPAAGRRAGALPVALLLVVVGGIIGCGADREQPVPPPAPDTEALLRQLEAPDKETWEDAVERLAARGPRVLPALVDALEAEHRAVREGAAHAIGDVGPEAAPAVGALLRRLPEEEDDFVRWKLIRALGRIGPAADAALPVLDPIAEDPRQTEIIRASAQAAVRRIRGTDAE